MAGSTNFLGPDLLAGSIQNPHGIRWTRRSGTRWLPAIVLWAASFALSAAEIGKPAPAFELPSIDGSASVRLEDFHGRLLLLDFWASWCQPCRESFPFYAKLREDLSGQKFEILAINLDEDSEDARDFLTRFPIDYPVALDPEGDVAALFQLKAMPMSYLIDTKGVVVGTHLGFRPSDMEEIRREIESHLDLD